jgi:hypothetical protein
MGDFDWAKLMTLSTNLDTDIARPDAMLKTWKIAGDKGSARGVGLRNVRCWMARRKASTQSSTYQAKSYVSVTGLVGVRDTQSAARPRFESLGLITLGRRWMELMVV